MCSVLASTDDAPRAPITDTGIAANKIIRYSALTPCRLLLSIAINWVKTITANIIDVYPGVSDPKLQEDL